MNTKQKKQNQVLKTFRRRFNNFNIPFSSLFVIIALVLITVCSSFSIEESNYLTPVKKPDYPRLIITSQNIDDFVRKSETTHKSLYDMAIRLADDFTMREPPLMLTARNTYREIGETMPSLGLAYLLTKERKYLNKAEEWINVLLNVPTWEGSQNLGRSAWVTGIAQLYDWLYNDMDEELKKRIISRLKKEAEIIKNSAASTRALSNHLLIETSAVGTVGLILPEDDPSRDNFLKQASLWTEYIIQNAPLDGSWGEGVQYWEYGLGYFLRYLEGALTSGYHDYFKDYDWLRKTGRFPIHFSVPGNLTRVINFSDCGSDRYIPPFLLYMPASKYNDGVVQDYALKIQTGEPHKFSWLDFLTYNSSLQPYDFKTVEKEFYHFEDHGFVTMRSSWKDDATLIGFHCGPAPGHANQEKQERISNRGYGPGHQHPDINSFVIYSNGTWLAIDPGYVHLKETRNYNTILVNGQGQAGAGEKWLDYMAFENREPAPKITLTESNSEYDYVIGNAGNIYVDEAGLECFERQLMFIKPDVIIVADRLKSKMNSVYTWSMHANEIADIDKMTKGFDIIKEKASLSVFPLLPEDMSSEVTERMLGGSDVHGDSDYSQREALLRTIRLNANGMGTGFLVVLTVNRPEEVRPEVSFENGMISILKKDRKFLINYRPEKVLSAKILEFVNP
jgi:hypothetical protein